MSSMMEERGEVLCAATHDETEDAAAAFVQQLLSTQTTADAEKP